MGITLGERSSRGFAVVDADELISSERFSLSQERAVPVIFKTVFEAGDKDGVVNGVKCCAEVE